MAAVQELLAEQIRYMEELQEVRVPRIIAKDRSDPFQCLTDEEFVERYRLPKDAVMALTEEVRPRAQVDEKGRGTEL